MRTRLVMWAAGPGMGMSTGRRITLQLEGSSNVRFTSQHVGQKPLCANVPSSADKHPVSTGWKLRVTDVKCPCFTGRSFRRRWSRCCYYRSNACTDDEHLACPQGRRNIRHYRTHTDDLCSQTVKQSVHHH